MACSSSRGKLTLCFIHHALVQGVLVIGFILKQVRSELFLLCLHNIIALQLQSFHGLEWWFTDGWGENGKGWRSCCCFLAPVGRWELQVLGYMLAPQSQGAAGPPRSLPGQEWGYSGSRTFSSTTGDICCEKHISTSYGRGWRWAPRLHGHLLVSPVSKTSPRSSMEASSP